MREGVASDEMIDTAIDHIPVLLNESLELLRVKPGGTYVDCTVGFGGHADQILRALKGKGLLIGMDRDSTALEAARRRLQPSYKNFQLHHENFKNLPLVLNNLSIRRIDGCLIDLGVSSHQITSPERGFSLRREGPLDMRMDPQQKITAAHLVNELSRDDLAQIFKRYGEERSAWKIADAIVERRHSSRLRTTTELAELVESVKGRPRGTRIHPATQIFQALRIEVNQELTGLDEVLLVVLDYLGPEGRLAVISFHSLEDRIVKRTFQKQAGRCICFKPRELCQCPREVRVQILTRKPVTPSEAELKRNPRARSAKLRAVERN